MNSCTGVIEISENIILHPKKKKERKKHDKKNLRRWSSNPSLDRFQNLKASHPKPLDDTGLLFLVVSSRIIGLTGYSYSVCSVPSLFAAVALGTQVQWVVPA